MTPAEKIEHIQQVSRDRQKRFYEKNKARLAEERKIKKQLDIQLQLGILEKLEKLEKRDLPEIRVQHDLLDILDIQDILDILDHL